MRKRPDIFENRTRKYQKEIEPKIRKFLDGQVNDFLKTLRGRGYNAAIAQANEYNLDFLPLLTELYKEAGLIGAKITAAELRKQLTPAEIRQILRAQKQVKSASFGRAAEWIKLVLDALGTDGLEMVQGINEETRVQMLEVLQRGFDQQLSIQEMADQLHHVSRVRANRIARTEIIAAANKGHDAVRDRAPFKTNKKWSAANDARTRDSHHSVDNHTIDADDLFKVPIYKKGLIIGYDYMTSPGDPKADLSNRINCRCRTTTQPQRDSNGKLIFKNPNQARIIPLKPTSIDAEDLRNAIAAQVKMKVD